MKKNLMSLAGFALVGAMSAQAALTTITLGNTTVSVNDQTAISGSTAVGAGTNGNPTGNGVNAGGLFDMTFNGTSLFNPFDAVRNNGFMVGGGNYADNYVGNALTGNVTVTGLSNPNSTTISVTGSYLNGAGGSVLGAWTRTYTLIANGIVREVVTFQNTTSGSLSNFRMHGSFDPDRGGVAAVTQTANTQGNDAGSGYNFARAVLDNGINTFLASNDVNVRVGFFWGANGLGMTQSCVNSLVSGTASGGCFLYGAGFNPGDYSYAWVRNFDTVAAGQSVSATVFHVFATGGSNLNITNTLNLIGNPPPPPPGGGDIPEPGTWAMMGSALVGLGAIARRRSRKS